MNITLGAAARGRNIKSDDDKYMIQEELNSYNAVLDTEKYNLRPKKRYYWKTFSENTDS